MAFLPKFTSSVERATPAEIDALCEKQEAERLSLISELEQKRPPHTMDKRHEIESLYSKQLAERACPNSELPPPIPPLEKRTRYHERSLATKVLVELPFWGVIMLIDTLFFCPVRFLKKYFE